MSIADARRRLAEARETAARFGYAIDDHGPAAGTRHYVLVRGGEAVYATRILRELELLVWRLRHGLPIDRYIPRKEIPQ